MLTITKYIIAYDTMNHVANLKCFGVRLDIELDLNFTKIKIQCMKNSQCLFFNNITRKDKIKC